jgi:predicted transcriptional regulator
MSNDAFLQLSRRERQIMDVLYRRGRASAAEVQAEMPDPPSYSAVRATLRILEDKGAVRHEEKEGKYLYLPAVGREKARRSALRNVIDVFFEGSTAQAAAALLGSPSAKFTQEEIDRLAGLIEKARKEGPQS